MVTPLWIPSTILVLTTLNFQVALHSILQWSHLSLKWTNQFISLFEIFQRYCGLNCGLSKCTSWSPAINVMVFGNRPFREVIKIKWSHKDGFPYKENMNGIHRRRGKDTRSAHTQRKGYVWALQEGSHPQTKSFLMAPWSWSFSPKNCKKINVLFKPPIMWHLFWQP